MISLYVQLKAVFHLNNWWHERNQASQRRTTADEIAGLRGRQTTEIRNFQKSIGGVTEVRSRGRRWETPPHGLLKLNVDGAFRDSDKKGGWGYVIHDENGEVIQSGSERVSFTINPMHMELNACIEGVKAAMSLGVNNIILQIDAQQVAWAVRVTISDFLWWVA